MMTEPEIYDLEYSKCVDIVIVNKKRDFKVAVEIFWLKYSKTDLNYFKLFFGKIGIR